MVLGRFREQYLFRAMGCATATRGRLRVVVSVVPNPDLSCQKSLGFSCFCQACSSPAGFRVLGSGAILCIS